MSAPFGGHPTLGQYIAWAEQEGCAVKYGMVNGKLVHVIDNPGKGFVSIVGVLGSEYLTPTTVARFDRRLGLDSPFPKLPDDFDVVYQ